MSQKMFDGLPVLASKFIVVIGRSHKTPYGQETRVQLHELHKNLLCRNHISPFATWHHVQKLAIFANN